MTPEPFKDDWGRALSHGTLILLHFGLVLIAIREERVFGLVVNCLGMAGQIILTMTSRSLRLFLSWFTQMVWNALRGEV